MDTVIDEVTTGIYRLSTYIAEADFSFNQYLIDADQPLLFHCGMRGLFPLVSAAVAKVMRGGATISPERLTAVLRRRRMAQSGLRRVEAQK